MIRFFSVCFLLFQITATEAQTLINLGSTRISSSEFLWSYNKSNSTALRYDEESLRNYLDLYINFRLKVLDAEAGGIDKKESFKEELAGYREKLAQRYLVEREVSDKLVREAYERSLKIINASHILILCAPAATPADTLKAFQKISGIRKQALEGEPFENLVSKYSEEPTESQGRLGNFSVFQMVYPFETAAYQTPKGQVSQIVRTRFGYHLIKVHDVFPNPGQVQLAHIFIADGRNSNGEEARQKAEELYKRLVAGADFETLARQFSDDDASAKNGGALPLLSMGQSGKAFEDAAFALSREGDIAKPVHLEQGWHIIKLLRKVPLPEFETVKSIIKTRVASDERSALGYEQFIQRLKKTYRFHQNVSSANINKLTDAYQVSVSKKVNPVLFSLNGNKIFLDEFAKYRKENPGDATTLYTDFINKKLVSLEDTNLESRYPDFRYLLNEYRNGILLYNISEEKVWNLAQTDSAGLRKFYESNKEDYTWKERVSAVSYFAASAKYIEQVKELLNQNVPADSILKTVNKSNPLNLYIREGVYQRGENEQVDQARWKPGTDTELKTSNGVVLVRVKDVLPPSRKTIEEVQGTLLSDYQDFLEARWLQQLRLKYPVIINNGQLKKLIR